MRRTGNRTVGSNPTLSTTQSAEKSQFLGLSIRFQRNHNSGPAKPIDLPLSSLQGFGVSDRTSSGLCPTNQEAVGAYPDREFEAHPLRHATAQLVSDGRALR